MDGRLARRVPRGVSVRPQALLVGVLGVGPKASRRVKAHERCRDGGVQRLDSALHRNRDASVEEGRDIVAYPRHLTPNDPDRTLGRRLVEQTDLGLRPEPDHFETPPLEFTQGERQR